jgi:hypothetical protein
MARGWSRGARGAHGEGHAFDGLVFRAEEGDRGVGHWAVHTYAFLVNEVARAKASLEATAAAAAAEKG